MFSFIFYFTEGITGELFFLYALTAISGPLFGSVWDAMVLIVLSGLSSVWVNLILAYQGKIELDGYHLGVLFLVWFIYFAIAGIIKFFQSGYVEELENVKKYQGDLLEKNSELEKTKAGIEQQVFEQTKKLQEQNSSLEVARKSVTNILEDVTESEKELRRKTSELEREKERTESILRFLRSIGDGVVATDLSGKILFFNKTAEKLSGVSSEDATGKHAGDILPIFGERSPEIPYDIVKESLACEDGACKMKDRFFLKQRDDSSISVSFSTSFIYDLRKNKQGLILTIRDTTEERELEKTKDNFLSVAAHQLRTPLSGIRWSLEMLLDGDNGKLPKEAKEVVSDINENTLRLAELVNDLLNVSRINLGKNAEAPKEMVVSEVVVSALKACQPMADKNRIKLSFKKGSTLKLKVKIAPQRFFESIENILSNAVKYTPSGGKVDVVVSKKDKIVEIQIMDNGIGIPKKDQEKVFSKFFRADNATKKDPEGSGLGLSVAKSFVEEAGGSLSFQSEEGKGTTFIFAIPLFLE
jgi:PAS domain S-box-containing protein